MDLICAHMPGTLGVVPRSLSPAERRVLADSRRSTEHDPETRALLRAIWRARLWIACDCRTRSGGAPMLFVRPHGPEDYVLTPMADRPPHDRQCVFSQGGGELRTEAPAETRDLDELLFRWVHAAKLNVVYPYAGADLVHTQFAGLREAAKTLDLTSGRRLYDYSRTHLDGLPELVKRVLTVKGVGQGASFPRAVFFTTVAELDASALEAALSHPKLPLESLIGQVQSTRVSMLSETASTRGPYIVVFAFGPNAQHSEVLIEKVYAQPIYSRGLLVPVLGAHERSTLTLLLAIQQELLRSHRILFVIRKLLPPMAGHERGIAYQLHRVGPNGRPIDTLEVLSVDGQPSESGEALEGAEMDWRHDRMLREALRGQGTVYHFVSAKVEGASGDVSFVNDATAWALSRAGTRIPPTPESVAAA